MTSTKKVLLVSATAGAGHVRAAEALLSELHTKHPDIITEHVNLVDFSHPLLRFTLSTAYTFSIRHSPILYEMTYKLSNNNISGILLRLLSSFLRVATGKYRKKIQDFEPDVIISTYFLSTLLLPPTTARVYTVITDYKYHRAWLNKQSVGYFVATDEIKKIIEKESDAEVTVNGIPIHPEFLKEKNVEDLKNKFGVNNHLPAILLMPCQSGTIAPDQIAKHLLNQPYNIIAVAGKNNHETYKKFLELKKSNQNFWPLEYSNTIDELIRMSDIVITKAGGVTVTECLHLGKPLLIVNPIPGQEKHNTEMLVKNNYGIRITELSEINNEIKKILNEPNYLQKAKLPDDPNDLIISAVIK